MTPVDYEGVADSELGKVGWPEVTEAGYALVIQHSRGRVGSEGETFLETDREDGIDLMNWVLEQSWSNGRIGTLGDSAGANFSFLFNAENPEGLQASFTQVGSPDLMNESVLSPGGALKLEMFLPWTALQAVTSDDHHFETVGYSGVNGLLARANAMWVSRGIMADIESPHTSDAWKHLPLRDYPALADVVPGWNRLLDTGYKGPDTIFFDTNASRVPTYSATMWFDAFATAQFNAFERGEAEGKEQRLIVLKGTHYEIDKPGSWPIQPMIPWFDHWLKDDADALADIPKVIFPIENADDEWYGADTWPVQSTERQVWKFGADGGLSLAGAAASKEAVQATRSFDYDPNNPVPTIGWRNLLVSSGPLDQSPARGSNRNDVLSYQGQILDESMLVAGHITGNLTVSSDSPDTDFAIKLLDIGPDGKALLVVDGILRMRHRSGTAQQEFMQAGESYDVEIDLGHIAWRFKPGHRIAIDISSSNFPQWDRNLNTAGTLYHSTEMRIANNTIHHGSNSVSSISLPIIYGTEGVTRLRNFRTQ